MNIYVISNSIDALPISSLSVIALDCFKMIKAVSALFLNLYPDSFYYIPAVFKKINLVKITIFQIPISAKPIM